MIEFTNVVKAYHTGNKALKGISMHINDGEFVFLVGPSGSGKSTIIKLITGEIQPTEGNVLVNQFHLESITQPGRSPICAGRWGWSSRIFA